MSNFKIALEFQFRAIYAISMREFKTRFGQKKIGFLWVILESITHVSIFATLKYLIGIAGPDGINIILFLITGIIPFFYFRNTINRMVSALGSNKSLLTISNISFLDFYYARFILESFLIFITLPIVFILGLVFVFNNDFYYFTGYQVNDILTILNGIFMLGLLGFGLGLIISSLAIFSDSIQLVSSVFIRMLYFTSGVLISTDKIPYHYHYLLEWNPIVHCMEALRTGFFQEYTPQEYFLNYDYVYTTALVLIFFGLLLVSRTKSWVLR